MVGMVSKVGMVLYLSTCKVALIHHMQIKGHPIDLLLMNHSIYNVAK